MVIELNTHVAVVQRGNHLFHQFLQVLVANPA